MKISFYGAAGEVTGSCQLVEVGDSGNGQGPRARVLVDFGQHQGDRTADARNRVMPPIEPRGLDSVVVTHAHVDHTGRLPLLVREGFRGRIYATAATCDLTRVLLRDAASLQAMDARRSSQRAMRRGAPAVEPLFTPEDVELVIERLTPIAFGQRIEVAPGVKIRAFDSGHILGSASIEMEVQEPGGAGSKRIVFSGDIGPRGVPILRDPVVPGEAEGLGADLVVLESTYGDRDHRPLAQSLDEVSEIVREAVWEKEKVLVPAFAVGRAQLLMHCMAELQEGGRVPRFPVYLDSPMAREASDAYRAHARLLDEEARDDVRRGRFLLDHPDVVCTCSAAESRALNDRPGAAVIIAGSGMCTGGRILHHLKHNVWRKGVHVLMVGYQASGTLGRMLVERRPLVRVLGETLLVRAKVHTVGGLSAHAGQAELAEWAARAVGRGADGGAGKAGAGGKPAGGAPRIVLTHGEERPRAVLGALLEQRLGARVEMPMWGQSVTV